MSSAVALRVIQGQKGLREAILDHLEQKRGPDFLEQLINPEHLAANGLSQELMEWLLVSQKVLLAQGG